MQDHKTKQSMKVWLSEQEVDQLLSAAIHPRARIAFALAARCGLRSEEVVNVTPEDIVETEAGSKLRVRGKGDKYRETPLPADLKTTIETAVEFREELEDQPVVLNNKGESTTTRTLRHWLADTTESLTDQDKMWLELSFHDLRRTWATLLASKSVDPLICLEWGGWQNLSTFLDHYKGAYSPEAQKRERSKVEWLD